jgi:hypothetical protein
VNDDDLLSDWVEALNDRRERFAESLYDLVYGVGAWSELADQGDDKYVADMRENYRADAWDIMLAHPHLLDLEMRTNLAHLGLIKED